MPIKGAATIQRLIWGLRLSPEKHMKMPFKMTIRRCSPIQNAMEIKLYKAAYISHTII